MKKASSYVGSFIVSVLLIFSIIASVGCLTAGFYAKSEKIIELAEEKNISRLVRSELEKYFSSQYGNTGIPAEIYMDALDEEYLKSIIDFKIKNGLGKLNGTSYEKPDFTNQRLEKNLSDFFSDYAESIGYKKDEKYDEKLGLEKQSSYMTIEEYCDAYKFKTLEEHGVLKKIKPLFLKIPMFTKIVVGAVVVLAVILLIINIRSKCVTLYWLGVSAVSAGAVGTAPCIYLTVTDYFSAFTIKQSQIYAAYTGIMNAVTQSFMSSCITAAAVGAVLLIIYGVISAAKNKNEDKSDKKESKSKNPENEEKK